MWTQRLVGLLAGLRGRAPRARGLLVPRRARSGRPKIAVRDVGHRFANATVALHDVNVEVHAGEFVCLVGPSGCGKTTLLYALAGHLDPSGGRVNIDGVQVKGPGPSRLARGIGMDDMIRTLAVTLLGVAVPLLIWLSLARPIA